MQSGKQTDAKQIKIKIAVNSIYEEKKPENVLNMVNRFQCAPKDISVASFIFSI